MVLVAIVLLTLLPASGKHFLHTRGRFHTVGHILVFAALAFAAGRSSRSWKTLLLLFAGLIGFGFLTELVEHLLYDIGLEWKDVVNDSVGVLLGSLLAFLAFAARKRATRLRSS